MAYEYILMVDFTEEYHRGDIDKRVKKVIKDHKPMIWLKRNYFDLLPRFPVSGESIRFADEVPLSEGLSDGDVYNDGNDFIINKIEWSIRDGEYSVFIHVTPTDWFLV